MPKQYDLIGGSSHGESAAVADSENSYDAPVNTGEDRALDSSPSESYTRREFAGEEFGPSYTCFGLTSDDDTDTRELARMEINAETARGVSSVDKDLAGRD